MTKAILVIDTPKKCFECPLMSEEMYCKAYAYIEKGKKLCVEDDVLHGTRTMGCPLKEMPSIDLKKDLENITSYVYYQLMMSKLAEGDNDD